MPQWGGGGANSGDQPAEAEKVTAPAETVDATVEEPAEANETEAPTGE